MNRLFLPRLVRRHDVAPGVVAGLLTHNPAELFRTAARPADPR